MKLKETYDIVVIGGGPAGLASAISILKKIDVSLLVVEGQAKGAERIGESCPPDTILLLKQLDVSQDFYQSEHSPCPGFASVWGKADVGYNDSIVNPLGPSWCLDRKKFDQMLIQKAQDLGAQMVWSTRFVDAGKTTAGKTGYTLRLVDALDKTEQCVTAKFVVDATGSKARFAKSIGISKQIDDQLFATARFADITEGKISKRVQLEATSSGWWYNTSLPDQRLVTMFVTEKENLPLLQEGDYQGFQQALDTTTFLAPALKKVTLGNIQFFNWPIYSGLLPHIEGEDWMAIGDAASSYDPIAAQGIYKGLSDGILSAKKLASFFTNDSAYDGSFSNYVRNRHDIYKKNRKHVYTLERRWPTASFWQNRWLNMP